MSIDITFTLHNEDLKRFEDVILKARETLDTEHGAQQVELAAMKMLKQPLPRTCPGSLKSDSQNLNCLSIW
jgi:hypothetical protein